MDQHARAQPRDQPSAKRLPAVRAAGASGVGGRVPSPDADPEEASFVAERARLVRTGLATLTPKQRQAIEIAYFSGSATPQSQRWLGEPLRTVKTRTRTGMIRLREYLAP